MDNIKKCFCKKSYTDRDGYVWQTNTFYSYLEYETMMYVSTVQHSNNLSTLPMAKMKKKIFRRNFDDIDERRESLIVNILE